MIGSPVARNISPKATYGGKISTAQFTGRGKVKSKQMAYDKIARKDGKDRSV